MSTTGNTLSVSQDAPTPAVVQRLVGQCTALWWESDARTLPPGPTYTGRRRSDNEAQLARFLDALMREALSPPLSEPGRRAVQERLLSAVEALGRSALGLEDRHLDLLHSHGFLEAAIEFAQRARHFDPQLSGDDIYQASRNAWVMFSLQLLMGQAVQLTPAILGYSLLYPYSDNFLDDRAIPAEAKAAFSERLAQRFAEPSLAPGNRLERSVWELVGMIEDQYERARHPEVFESLSAIRRAQKRSTVLLRHGASPYEVDVLGISLEKGGTSVLADGYLVAGSLSEAERGFLFGFGAFLQLADDLQDVGQNYEEGLLTVFTQTAEHWRLDRVTNRTFHFGAQVLEGLDCFDAPDLAPLKEMIKRSTDLLLVEAASRAERFYTRPYLRNLEARLPVRFSALRKARRRLTRRRNPLAGLLEAFLVPAEPGGAAVQRLRTSGK